MPNKKVDTNEIGNLFGHPKDFKNYNSSNSLVLPKTLIGVEVEIEGMAAILNTLHSRKRSNPALSMYKDNRGNWMFGGGFWQIKTDGSLRNNGVEFVTDKLFGEDLIHALDELGEFLLDNSCSISDRCGIHVHIDVRDLKPEEYERLILDYIIFEKILFKYCGINRQNNLYCLPFCRSDHYKRVMSDISHSIKSGKKFVGFISNFERYSALNLAATSKYGSLEFRQLPTTTDMSRVLDWINIIMCLKKNCFDNNSDNLHKEISKHGFSNYLEHIFGKHSSILDDSEPDILEGIRLVQEVINYNNLNSNCRDYFSKNNAVNTTTHEEYVIPRELNTYIERNNLEIVSAEVQAEINTFNHNNDMLSPIDMIRGTLREIGEEYDEPSEEEEGWTEEDYREEDEYNEEDE